MIKLDVTSSLHIRMFTLKTLWLNKEVMKILPQQSVETMLLSMYNFHACYLYSTKQLERFGVCTLLAPLSLFIFTFYAT